jgi:hypothetical protein
MPWHTTGQQEDILGRFDEKRTRIRRRAQQSPWEFSRGLAHVLATVAEPRSDDVSYDVAFDAYVDGHRQQLINEIGKVVAAVDTSGGALRLGGKVEDVLDRAAERLQQVAREQAIDDVAERLNRLVDERRFGVPDRESVIEAMQFTLDISDIPRSTASDRRVGLWR